MRNKIVVICTAILLALSIGIPTSAHDMAMEYDSCPNYSKEPVFYEGHLWRPIDLDNDCIVDYYCMFVKSGDMVVAIYDDTEWNECGIEVTINGKMVYDSFAENNIGD